jgi:lipopolysaccharide biosynthesis protein
LPSPDGTYLKRRLCLFSHYDPDGKIDDYVTFYVESLHKLGTDIIFISTSENLVETEIEKVLPFCIHLIQRKNISLDFGSWKIGWMRANSMFGLTNNYDQLILANDSVYGPFFPISEIFATMESRELEMWGMSSNQEIDYHLQSFFLVFEKATLRSEALAQFWDKFLFYRSKSRIIQEYELGLSHLAKAKNWKTGAFVERDEQHNLEMNSTLFSWDKLIEEDRFPFLKTEVLKLNRAKSPRISEWANILKAQSSYPTELVQHHLDRVL